jgi:Holliday junction DNA helicase RuvA
MYLMISTLHGKVTETGNRYAVIENNGIGYKVSMTSDAILKLKVGANISLWTHLAIREDAHELYGFISKKERDFFELLITVSSIGPKTALNILSLVDADTLSGAVKTGSTAHLVKVSGLGRKTAEKIVLELKDKLGKTGWGEGANTPAGMSSDMDAIEALKALGYDADEAREALKKIGKSKDGKEISDTGDKVKAALKMLS